MHRITQAREKGLYTTALAVDISQFFPSIRHDVLEAILTYQGFPPFLVNCIRNWLEARATIYAMAAAHSNRFSLNIGVPQGDPLSPLLSALYIAPVLFRLFDNTFHRPLACIFYVDDGVLIHSSTSMHYNMYVLKTKFQQLVEAFREFGLTLEPAKMELMHFSAYDLTKRGKPLFSGPFPSMDLGVAPFTGDTPLKPALLWRYLGFFFDPKLSFSYHVDFYVHPLLDL